MDPHRALRISEAELSESRDLADRLKPKVALDGREAWFHRFGHPAQRCLVSLCHPIQPEGLHAEALNQFTAGVDHLGEPLPALLLCLEEWMHHLHRADATNDLFEALQVRGDQLLSPVPQRLDPANIERSRQSRNGCATAGLGKHRALGVSSVRGDTRL
jgi:hypothetical protein